MRLFSILSALLFAVPVWGQQPDKPVQVDAPGVPGGKVTLVPRDQLRAGPGTKTARLPHPMRAAINKGEPAAGAVVAPKAWDWVTKDGKQVKLPLYGNNQYGDCYYVTLVKEFIIFQWQVQGTQLSFDEKALVNRYLQVAGGDNGMYDAQAFKEIKGGVIGPNGPHKAIDVLIVPATDKAALDLTGWAFGPHMFTFTVYSNFSQNAKPGATFTSSSGRVLGGHAVPLSGKKANGNWQLETWGMQPSIEVSPSWVAGVDPEFISVFSLEWFDAKGFAPNGLHYTVLAPMWNSMGGNVPVPGPFPPPDPDPNPKPGKFTGELSVTTTTTFTFKDGILVKTEVKQGGAGPAPKVDPAAIRDILEKHWDSKFPNVVGIAGVTRQEWIDLLFKLLMAYLDSQKMSAAPKADVSGTVAQVYLLPGRTDFFTIAVSEADSERSVMIGPEYRKGKHVTFNGKPVTTKQLVAELLAHPDVQYSGSADPTTYGVHTNGKFTAKRVASDPLRPGIDYPRTNPLDGPGYTHVGFGLTMPKGGVWGTPAEWVREYERTKVLKP